MKLNLLSTLFLIMPFLLFAQNENDKTIYLDSTFQKTEKEYTYYRVIKDFNLDKNSYEIEEFYKSGKLFSKGKSITKEHIQKDGEYITYYENGNKKSKCEFLKGAIVGNFETWYENGTKKAIGKYVNLPKIGNQLKIEEFWDANTIQTVKDGEGSYETEEPFMNITMKGLLKNGLKDGEWIGKSSNKKFSFTEIYNQGKMVSGESTDSNNKKNKYNEINELPIAKGGLAGFSNYIAKNYKIPRNAPNVDGTIIASFIVATDGSLEDIKIVRGLGEYYDKEAIRVLKSSKDWKAGKSRGIEVRVAYNVPIKLKTT